jgi:putative membrane protein
VAGGALGIVLRGLLMGAADIVPGVSGGTMAFITGIYARLLDAITAFDLSLLRMLLQGDWRAAWQRVDAGFLLALVAGILCSVLSLARLISYLLVAYPVLLWAFFFGLILASALVLLRRVQSWSPVALAGLVLGAALAAFIGLSPALSFPAGPAGFFFAGFLAICAMILPGISGSFILVLLGMYARVLDAIYSFDILLLGLFAVGAACGLLVFSRALRFLLDRFHSATMATLTGFLLGSLPVIWPWKLNAVDEVPARPVLPASYAEQFGDSALLLCVALVTAGFFAVWLLESRWGGPER